MRRMLTWLRLTMTPSRLNDLVVCHIHASRLSGIVSQAPAVAADCDKPMKLKKFWVGVS